MTPYLTDAELDGLLDRASSGERVLLLLPSLLEAATEHARLAARVADSSSWKVIRTSGYLELTSTSGGFIRVHTAASPGVAYGRLFDHALAFCRPTQAEDLMDAVRPALVTTGGELLISIIATDPRRTRKNPAQRRSSGA